MTLVKSDSALELERIREHLRLEPGASVADYVLDRVPYQPSYLELVAVRKAAVAQMNADRKRPREPLPAEVELADRVGKLYAIRQGELGEKVTQLERQLDILSKRGFWQFAWDSLRGSWQELGYFLRKGWE